MSSMVYERGVRKIIQVCDSAAVMIPVGYFESNKLEIGDSDECNYDGEFQINPIDPEDVKRKLGE